MTRRDLLKSATCAMAGTLIAYSDPAGKLPIAVSTLGCPKWDWNTIVRNTSSWGFAALELRGIQDQMDLTKCPEFTGTRLKSTLQDLSVVGLSISDLGASAQMHEPDAAKRTKHMDEARRFIDLAHELHAPYVRVFPNQFVPGEDKPVTFARISDGLHELGEYARPSGVVVIVEAHGEFRRAEEFLRRECRESEENVYARSAITPEIMILSIRDETRHRPTSMIRDRSGYFVWTL